MGHEGWSRCSVVWECDGLGEGKVRSDVGLGGWGCLGPTPRSSWVALCPQLEGTCVPLKPDPLPLGWIRRLLGLVFGH